LLSAVADTLPSPARVLLARVTWEPGAELGPHTFTGPVGLLGESGELTLSGPSGIEGRLSPGKGVVFPADTLNRERNTGTEAVTVILVGVLDAGREIAVPAASPSNATSMRAPGDAVTVSVEAVNPEWTDTGVDVTTGQSITVTASGEVSMCTSGCLTGPDGRDDLNCSVEPCGGLFARIGTDGEELFVGSATTFSAEDAGRLFLRILDNDNGFAYFSNSGSFAVVISVE
jgi:hypothetical protein